MKNKKEYKGEYLSLYDYLGQPAGGELGRNDFLNECKDKGIL